ERYSPVETSPSPGSHLPMRHCRSSASAFFFKFGRRKRPTASPTRGEARRHCRADQTSTRSNLRSRLLARLIDCGVLAMGERRLAIGNHQRIELDEAMALLLVIAGDVRPCGEFVAGLAGR